MIESSFDVQLVLFDASSDRGLDASVHALGIASSVSRLKRLRMASSLRPGNCCSAFLQCFPFRLTCSRINSSSSLLHAARPREGAAGDSICFFRGGLPPFFLRRKSGPRSCVVNACPPLALFCRKLQQMMQWLTLFASARFVLFDQRYCDSTPLNPDHFTRQYKRRGCLQRCSAQSLCNYVVWDPQRSYCFLFDKCDTLVEDYVRLETFQRQPNETLTEIRNDCNLMLLRFDRECHTSNFTTRWSRACTSIRNVHEYRNVYYKVQTYGAPCYIA